MNLPNKLTLIRVGLVPVFMFFLLAGANLPLYSILALITFILASLTDGLDGFLARKNKSITKFGKILDPVADKLLISAALISFVALERISAWVAVIIIGRELAITGLRIVAASEGVVIAASNLGKLKTNLQMAAVIALIIDPVLINLPFNLSQIILYAAVLVTIYSGIDYFQRAEMDLFKEEK